MPSVADIMIQHGVPALCRRLGIHFLGVSERPDESILVFRFTDMDEVATVDVSITMDVFASLRAYPTLIELVCRQAYAKINAWLDDQCGGKVISDIMFIVATLMWCQALPTKTLWLYSASVTATAIIMHFVRR